MERVWKWLLPTLIVLEIGLVGTGVLEAGPALAVGAVIEIALVLVALRHVIVAVRHYRRDRAAGLDVEAALEDGLAVLLPRPLARLAALEPRVWICVYRWARGRHRVRALGEFPYARRSMVGALLGMVLLSAPVEILVFELLIPWPLVRILLLGGAVYGAFWMLGLYAALQVLPYRLEAGGLRVHCGLLADGLLPSAAITEVVVERRKAPEGREGLRVTPDPPTAYLAAGGRTDVTVRLRAPVVLQGLLRPTPPVTTVCLAADDPAALAAALHARAGRAGDHMMSKAS